MKGKTKVPQLLGKSDMAQRWDVSKQRLTYWQKVHEDFPKPAAIVHDGKTPLYSIEDVVKYEENRNLLNPEETGN